MANITIAGSAMVLTSALKLEDIIKLEKYRPKALRLYGGEDGKELVFAIGTCSSGGDICDEGVSFGGKNAEGYAQMTVTFEGIPASEIKPMVAECFGAALMNLNKLEAGIPAVLNQLQQEYDQVQSMIQVIA